MGRDALSLRHSQVPAAVVLVKDRVMGRSPAAALYTANSMYSRFKKKLNLNEPSYVPPVRRDVFLRRAL